MTENNSQWHSKVAPHCSDAHLLNLKLIEILKLCGKLMEFGSAAKELLFRFYSESFKRNDLAAKRHFDINKIKSIKKMYIRTHLDADRATAYGQNVKCMRACILFLFCHYLLLIFVFSSFGIRISCLFCLGMMF